MNLNFLCYISMLSQILMLYMLSWEIGVIKSLNVHVSGAIAVWEDTRQRYSFSHLRDFARRCM